MCLNLLWGVSKRTVSLDNVLPIVNSNCSVKYKEKSKLMERNFMKYDFENILERHGNDALAIDAVGIEGPNGFLPGAPEPGYSILPMWVADMNFKTAPCIIEAIQKRAAHASFGYFFPRDEYFTSIINWHKIRYGTTAEKEYIGYENGVLGALSSVLSAFTKEGDSVLINSPTYIGFLHTLEDMERKPSASPLYRDENGIWRMDFCDMEKRIIEEKIKVAVFCSPYNPIGRVWERSEIEEFVSLCKKHDVIIFSDEIWCDLTLGGKKHIPTYSVNDDAKERVICAYAPSKTFSLAGLVGSYHVIPNENIRSAVVKAGDKTHYNSMNVLSQHALIGAYSDEGACWVDELLTVLKGNVDYACSHIESRYKGVSFARPEGTYMLYLDWTEYMKEHNETDFDKILKKGWDKGVIWQDGRPFGMENTIRINLALPLWQVKEAFRRLDDCSIFQ